MQKLKFGNKRKKLKICLNYSIPPISVPLLNSFIFQTVFLTVYLRIIKYNVYLQSLARFPETVITLIITPVWPVCYTCYVYVLMSYSVYMLPALFRTRNKLSFKKLIFFLKLFKMQKFKKKRTALES